MLSGAWRARDAAESRKQEYERVAEQLGERVIELEDQVNCLEQEAHRKEAQLVEGIVLSILLSCVTGHATR